jgi:hypothetical protein
LVLVKSNPSRNLGVGVEKASRNREVNQNQAVSQTREVRLCALILKYPVIELVAAYMSFVIQGEIS